MVRKKKETTLGKIWYFIWEDDSLASWLVNILLAFLLVKFIIYPGLGLIFGTNYPVVAVVSGSMSHDNLVFDDWWEGSKHWYDDHGISHQQFKEFPFKDGFYKGDIMVLFGSEPEDIKIGQVIVYESHPDYPPIIHRVVSKIEEEGKIYFITKGDHNLREDERRVPSNKLLGKAVLRIPYLGWVKIIFTSIVQFLLKLF